MLPFAPTPLLARIPACLAGLFLAASISLAHAQTMPEIQRLMKQGQLPQALAKADLYIAARPREAQDRFMKGLILTEMGRADEAIATFTRLTEDFPELPEPYNNLAVLHARLKQYDKALAALEMAIRAHPDYAVAYENATRGDGVISVTAQNGKLGSTTGGAAGAGRVAVPGAIWETTTTAGQIGIVRIAG